MSKELLKIEDLKIIYKTDMEIVHAVNGIDLSINEQETLGLVGETGAGKTSTALAILRLLPDRTAKVVQGRIMFQGEDSTARIAWRKNIYDFSGSNDVTQPCYYGGTPNRRSACSPQ